MPVLRLVIAETSDGTELGRTSLSDDMVEPSTVDKKGFNKEVIYIPIDISGTLTHLTCVDIVGKRYTQPINEGPKEVGISDTVRIDKGGFTFAKKI
jgi:hypothetical protein